MSTFNVSVNGVEVLSQIPPEKLKESLITIRGLVWTSGGSDKNIKITENIL